LCESLSPRAKLRSSDSRARTLTARWRGALASSKVFAEECENEDFPYSGHSGFASCGTRTGAEPLKTVRNLSLQNLQASFGSNVLGCAMRYILRATMQAVEVRRFLTSPSIPACLAFSGQKGNHECTQRSICPANSATRSQTAVDDISPRSSATYLIKTWLWKSLKREQSSP